MRIIRVCVRVCVRALFSVCIAVVKMEQRCDGIGESLSHNKKKTHQILTKYLFRKALCVKF